MARALLIVPPLIKYTAGPLLGPSLLKSAAVARGHACQVLDLNAHWLSRERTGESSRTDLIRGPFVGDHDKPRTSQGESFLSLIEQRFLRQHILPGLDIQDNDEASLKRIRLAFLDHTDIRRAALYMHSSNFGSWAKDQLAGITTSPGVVGLSLLHAGQVIPAVAITWLVREMWPSAVVAWGGPHLSGLGLEALQQDLPERLSYTADIFVLGHAEETFVQLLDEAKEHTGSILIGQRSKRAVSPLFDSLNLYDTPVTLPAQSSIGCAYGK